MQPTTDRTATTITYKVITAHRHQYLIELLMQLRTHAFTFDEIAAVAHELSAYETNPTRVGPNDL